MNKKEMCDGNAVARDFHPIVDLKEIKKIIDHENEINIEELKAVINRYEKFLKIYVKNREETDMKMIEEIHIKAKKMDVLVNYFKSIHSQIELIIRDQRHGI